MKLEFWEAVATLIGIIIGAGIFGIPYVVAKAGFLTGTLVLIVLGIIVLMLYLYLGEVVLRTKGKHQLTGYAEIYLGEWGKRVMFLSMILGLYGALIAYLIGEGAALSAIFGGSSIVYTLGFFCIVAFLLYFGLEALEKSELVTIILILFVVAVIIIFTVPQVSVDNLKSFDIKQVFTPFGVILFAYFGLVAIPETNEILVNDRKHMKTAIYFGMIIPIIIYFLFTLVVVGSIGLQRFELLEVNQRIATIALGEILSQKLFIFANVFAIFAMFTSFMAVGYALKEMFLYDYNLPKFYAWGLTCIIPLGVALAGITNFIQILDISGVISGGIGAILVLMMFHKAKITGLRKPEYTVLGSKIISLVIALVFIAGAFFLII